MGDNNYVMMPTSMAHTFGNMTAFVTEYVKGLFPKDYFETVTIASTISYRYFNIFANTNKEFIKKNKPMLIIRPRLDVMNDDVFLNNTLLTTRITDNFFDRDFGNLQPFVVDKKNGLDLSFLMNRIKMYFDVSIIIESQMEQFNKALYLKNAVRQNMPFYLETALESNIPRPIMQAMAKDINIDINNTKEFLDYVNTYSLYPVTYKLKNSSGRDEFFQYYPMQVDAMISGLSIDDGSKKNFVDDAYAINFTLETEFTTAGLYYYFSKDPETIQLFSMMLDGQGFMDGNTKVQPTYTKLDLFTEEPPVGWVLYTAPFYKVESNSSPDVLEFTSLLNSSLERTIEYQLQKGLSPEMALKVMIYKDNEKLDPAKGDYSVDFAAKSVTTNRVNTTSTYRMVLYVNTLYINTLVSELLEFDEEK